MGHAKYYVFEFVPVCFIERVAHAIEARGWSFFGFFQYMGNVITKNAEELNQFSNNIKAFQKSTIESTYTYAVNKELEKDEQNQADAGDSSARRKQKLLTVI